MSWQNVRSSRGMAVHTTLTRHWQLSDWAVQENHGFVISGCDDRSNERSVVFIASHGVPCIRSRFSRKERLRMVDAAPAYLPHHTRHWQPTKNDQEWHLTAEGCHIVSISSRETWKRSENMHEARNAGSCIDRTLFDLGLRYVPCMVLVQEMLQISLLENYQ